MTQIKIRKYKESDAKFLAEIYYHTIHNINIRDYSKEQVEAWAPRSCLELDGWRKKWKKLTPFVATIGKKIVGFAEFEDNGHIDCFYIHHLYQKKSVGSTLMNAIKEQAKTKNINRIFAEVSITARPFFEKMGFEIIREQIVNIRSVDLKNFVMEVRLK